MSRTLPILMNGQMVRATMDNRKTQTRRLISPQPDGILNFDGVRLKIGGHSGLPTSYIVPPYQPGDILWVRETVCTHCGGDSCYRADSDSCGLTDHNRPPSGWTPSIHMPKWAARLFLRVTPVRVERLQDISIEDCIAEGIDTAETACPVRRDGLHSDAWYDGEGCEACGATGKSDCPEFMEICPACGGSGVKE